VNLLPRNVTQDNGRRHCNQTGSISWKRSHRVSLDKTRRRRRNVCRNPDAINICEGCRNIPQHAAASVNAPSLFSVFDYNGATWRRIHYDVLLASGITCHLLPLISVQSRVSSVISNLLILLSS